MALLGALFILWSPPPPSFHPHFVGRFGVSQRVEWLAEDHDSAISFEELAHALSFDVRAHEKQAQQALAKQAIVS